MKQVICVFRWCFADISNALRLRLFFCLFLNASILFPCLLNAATLPRNCKVIKSIVELPYFEKGRIPRIGGNKFFPVNIMTEKFKSIRQRSLSADMSGTPINDNSHKATDERTEQAGKDNLTIMEYFYHFVHIGFVLWMGLIIIFALMYCFFFVVAGFFFGHLEIFFPRDWLRKLHIPKFFYVYYN